MNAPAKPTTPWEFLHQCVNANERNEFFVYSGAFGNLHIRLTYRGKYDTYHSVAILSRVDQSDPRAMLEQVMRAARALNAYVKTKGEERLR